MRRRAHLLGLIPIGWSLLLLAGCAGNVGSDCGLAANPAYAGQYAGTFTPSSANGSVGGREFRLSVLSSGGVAGFVRDTATGGAFETGVTGEIQDSKAGCGTGDTSIALRYTLPGGAPEMLTATKTISGSIAVRLGTRVAVGVTTTSGRLGLERVAQTAE